MTLQQLRVYDGESEACDGSICVAGLEKYLTDLVNCLSNYLIVDHGSYASGDQ